MKLTVGQLREYLQNTPDDFAVVVFIRNSSAYTVDECWCNRPAKQYILSTGTELDDEYNNTQQAATLSNLG